MPVRLKLNLGDTDTGIFIEKAAFDIRRLKITIRSTIGNVGQCNIDHSNMVFHDFDDVTTGRTEMVLPLNIRENP